MVSGAQVSSVGIGHLQLQSTAVAHIDIQVFFWFVQDCIASNKRQIAAYSYPKVSLYRW